MLTSLFTGATALFFGITILLAALVLYGLRVVLARSSWAPDVQRRLWLKTALALTLWLVALGFIASSGFLLDFKALPPHLLVVGLPPLLTLVALSFSSRFTELLRLIPPVWVVGLQSFRIVVELGLWMLFLDGIIPAAMTFESRNLDVLSGLTAPLAAWLLARHAPQWVIALWNVAGLCLLLNIVVTAILSAPTPFRQFFDGPANTIIAQFPFVWLPGFLVPLAYWLHVISLRQLGFARPVDPARPGGKLAPSLPG
jgi:hypothetical protein